MLRCLSDGPLPSGVDILEGDRSQQLCEHDKEARVHHRVVSIFNGTQLWPPALVPPRAPLSMCCSARRRTVCAISFESDSSFRLYPYVRLEVRTETCGSQSPAVVARSAAEACARLACVPKGRRFREASAVV